MFDEAKNFDLLKSHLGTLISTSSATFQDSLGLLHLDLLPRIDHVVNPPQEQSPQLRATKSLNRGMS